MFWAARACEKWKQFDEKNHQEKHDTFIQHKSLCYCHASFRRLEYNCSMSKKIFLHVESPRVETFLLSRSGQVFLQICRDLLQIWTRSGQNWVKLVEIWPDLIENWIEAGRSWKIPTTKLVEFRGLSLSNLALDRQLLGFPEDSKLQH